MLPISVPVRIGSEGYRNKVIHLTKPIVEYLELATNGQKLPNVLLHVSLQTVPPAARAAPEYDARIRKRAFGYNIHVPTALIQPGKGELALLTVYGFKQRKAK